MIKKILITLLTLTLLTASVSADAINTFRGFNYINEAGLIFTDGRPLYFGTGAGATAGVYTADVKLTPDGTDLIITGSGGWNFAGSTGTFKTSSGANTLSGDVTIAADKNLGGAAGAGNVDFGAMTGTFASPTGLHTFGGQLAADWDMGAQKITIGAVEVIGDITYGGNLIPTGGPYLILQTIVDPVVANTEYILDDTPINSSGFSIINFTGTTASDSVGVQPDVARRVSVDPSGDLTGWVLVEGLNIKGDAISEFVNFSASSTLAKTDAAFLTITEISGNKTSGDDRTIDVGITDELGLDLLIYDNAQILSVGFDGLKDASQTITKGATIELCTIDIDGTLDGAKNVTIRMSSM